MRWGKEARDVHNEPLAPVDGNRQTLGSSILFTSRLHDKPMPYKAPKWARKITPENLYKRASAPGNMVTGGSNGWHGDTIRDNERIRFELLSIVLGVWTTSKTVANTPKARTGALEWVGMVPGKREAAA